MEFLLGKCVRSDPVALSLCSASGEERGLGAAVNYTASQVRHNRLYELNSYFFGGSSIIRVAFHCRPHMGTGQMSPVPLPDSPTFKFMSLVCKSKAL